MFDKKTKAKETSKADEKVIIHPDVLAKADDICVVEGCNEPKAPAQTYVCTKHCRSN